MAVITIRGKLGSGAPEIGKLVANSLQVDYIDREIIAEVAARLNLQEQEVLAKEMPPTRLHERIAEALARGYAIGDGIQGAYLPVWQIPFDDSRYVEALSSFIRELARTGCVIYGRGSQFILKNEPGAIHISVVAPYYIRLRRVMDTMHLPNEECARKEINRSDSSGREFARRFFGTDPEDPEHYHLVINTGRLSYESAASIILEAVRQQEAWAIY